MGNDDRSDRCCTPLPPGFRFRPTDEELLTHYLARKAADAGFAPAAVREVDLYKAEPWDLMPAVSGDGGDDGSLYFFCARRVKFPSGLRANRATRAGYWKSTGKDKLVPHHGSGGEPLGVKKTLVFYRGRAPRGDKTNWVMHEYRLVEGHAAWTQTFARGRAQIEWVVCRMFMKKPPGGEASRQETALHPHDDHLQMSTDELEGSKAPAPAAAGSEQANFSCDYETYQGLLQQSDEDFLVKCRELDGLSSSALPQATLLGEDLAADSSFDLQLPKLLDYESFPFIHDF